MYTIIDKFKDTFFHTTSKYDLSAWEHMPDTELPVYGIYHIFCDKDWQKMVSGQIDHLKSSGLFERTTKLYVSIIARNDEDIAELRRIVGDDSKLEIIADGRDPRKFEYPALQFLRRKCIGEDCLVYYFHTKGITYQNLSTADRKFNNFKRNIEAWRLMMEYFLFDKWKVAVNLLSGSRLAAADGPQRRPIDGERFDVYGCYRFNAVLSVCRKLLVGKGSVCPHASRLRRESYGGRPFLCRGMAFPRQPEEFFSLRHSCRHLLRRHGAVALSFRHEGIALGKSKIHPALQLRETLPPRLRLRL